MNKEDDTVPFLDIEIDNSDDEDPADDGRPICDLCGFPGCTGSCNGILGLNTP